MKIEALTKDNYRFFINKLLIKINLENKEDIIDYVKEIILKKKKTLNLRGFYKVIVYVNKKCGLFMELVKLEDSNYFNNLDLRVIVNLEADVYFETEDFFLIKKALEIRYNAGLFYCLVDDSFDEKFEKAEFGKYIFGDDVINMLAKSIIL